MMVSLSQMREDITLTAYEANYLDGLHAAEAEDLSAYDIIVSRGGTADLLRKMLSIPVVSIDLSYYDILNAIKLAQSYSESCAIIAFPSIASSAQMLVDILQYKIPVQVINNEDELPQVFDALLKQNKQIFLGDFVVTKYAKYRGYRAILITSGLESVSQAFDRAVELVQYYQQYRQSNFFYRTAFRLSQKWIMVLDMQGQQVFTDVPVTQSRALHKQLRRTLPALIRSDSVQTVLHTKDKAYLVNAAKLNLSGAPMALFELTDLRRNYELFDEAVLTRDANDAPADPNLRLFYGGNATAEVMRKADSYSKASAVILAGEAGTGKDSFAYYLYRHGPYNRSALTIINCPALTAQSLQTLLRSNSSPFFSKSCTIYIKNLEQLPTEQLRQLLSFLGSAGVASGNQLIFSVEEPPSLAKQPRDDSIIHAILAELPCVTLRLPPLRQRIYEIPTLVSLYIAELANHNAYQIAGIEPEGMALLQGYTWPGNLRQLRSILDTLAQITTDPYIRSDDVKDILHSQETAAIESDLIGVPIDLSQPLNGIIADIIRFLLQQEGMNRTKVADRLGICRTTLWKYLKDSSQVNSQNDSLFSNNQVPESRLTRSDKNEQ